MLAVPVLIRSDAGRVGTGFYIQNQQVLFFVTAKHVFFDQKTGALRSEPTVLISYPTNSLDPSEIIRYHINIDALNNDRKLHTHSSRDVVALEIGRIQTTESGRTEFVYSHKYVQRLDHGTTAVLSVDHNRLRKYQDTTVGKETYLFGYPRSIGIPHMPQLDPDQPLLRKGVIAGKNPRRRTIVLDSAIYGGNSGGPVVEIDISGFESQYYLIGIVLEFVPFLEEWENKQHRYSNLTISNSGYSIVEPVDSLIELLDLAQTPAGEILKTASEE